MNTKEIKNLFSGIKQRRDFQNIVLFEETSLYQMGNQFLTVAAQQINYRNFDHGITSGLLFHGGACHANQHLRGKSRIINLHVKLEQLIVSLARYPFANQVNAMTYVVQIVHTWNLFYMCLVIYK